MFNKMRTMLFIIYYLVKQLEDTTSSEEYEIKEKTFLSDVSN